MLFGLFHRKPRTREELDAYNERKRLHLDIKHARRVWKEIKRDYRNRFVWGSGQQSLYLQQDGKGIVVCDAAGNPRGTLQGLPQDTLHAAPPDNLVNDHTMVQPTPNTRSPLLQAAPMVQDDARTPMYQLTVIPPQSPQVVAASVRPEEGSAIHLPTPNDPTAVELPSFQLPILDHRSPDLSPLSPDFAPLNALPRVPVVPGPLPMSSQASPSRWYLQPVDHELLQRIRIPITLHQQEAPSPSPNSSASISRSGCLSLTPQPPSVHNETLHPIPPVPIALSRQASLTAPSVASRKSESQRVASRPFCPTQEQTVAHHGARTILGSSDVHVQPELINSAHAQLDESHYHDGVLYPSDGPDCPPGLPQTHLCTEGFTHRQVTRDQGAANVNNHPEAVSAGASRTRENMLEAQDPARTTQQRPINPARNSDVVTLQAWNLTMCDMLVNIVKAWDLGSWLRAGIPTERALHSWVQTRLSLLRVLLGLRVTLEAVNDCTPFQALQGLRVYLQEQCYEMHRPLQTSEEQTRSFQVFQQGIESAMGALQNPSPPLHEPLSQATSHRLSYASLPSTGNGNQRANTNTPTQPVDLPVRSAVQGEICGHSTVTNSVDDGTSLLPQGAGRRAQANPRSLTIQPPPVILAENDIWRFHGTALGGSNNPPAQARGTGTYGCRYMDLYDINDDDTPLAHMDLVRTPRDPMQRHSPPENALRSQFCNVTSQFAHPRPERSYDLAPVIHFSPTIAGSVGLRSPREHFRG